MIINESIKDSCNDVKTILKYIFNVNKIIDNLWRK